MLELPVMRFPLERGLGARPAGLQGFFYPNPPCPLKKGESPKLVSKQILDTQKFYSLIHA